MARPKINPKLHRKDITITLPPPLIERAKCFREIAGWTISGMVENALNVYFRNLDREIDKKCNELRSKL